MCSNTCLWPDSEQVELLCLFTLVPKHCKDLQRGADSWILCIALIQHTSRCFDLNSLVRTVGMCVCFNLKENLGLHYGGGLLPAWHRCEADALYCQASSSASSKHSFRGDDSRDQAGQSKKARQAWMCWTLLDGKKCVIINLVARMHSKSRTLYPRKRYSSERGFSMRSSENEANMMIMYDIDRNDDDFL